MQKVLVGLSGGVDSAVSAALLKEQGYDVVGAFIKIWQPEFIECTWREDRLDAMRVCAALGIPFREVDLSEEYKNKVVVDMVENYRDGRTPNPDVLCNRHIKFGDFAAWAFRSGAEMIATGHYARVIGRDPHNDIVSRYELRRGADTNKDQSYFLWQLSEDDLSRTLFPVGGMTKAEVRKEARRFELPVADKRDSQGLCFIGDVSMKDFLKRYLSVESGPVYDMQGNIIGEHEGATLYTIGERHGFTSRHASAEKYPERAKRVEGLPNYIVAIDVAANAIQVSENRDDAARPFVELEGVNWISKEPHLPFEADIETRYREASFRARVELNSGNATRSNLIVSVRVEFSEPHVVSLGQSLVIYDSDRCLGGGIIK